MGNSESRMNPKFPALRKINFVTTESNRIREGNGGKLRWRKEGKKKSFCFWCCCCFFIPEFQLIFCHPCFYVICASTVFFGEIVYFILHYITLSPSLSLSLSLSLFLSLSLSLSLFLSLTFFFFFCLLQLYYPNGITPVGNSGCLPRGKPAATESRYPTYGACWVF